MKQNVLFRTIHGSRLYGLDHEDSDFDWYVVVEKAVTKKKKFITQHISGREDVTTVDFGTWQNLCMSGEPKALEAMFSQKAHVDRIKEFRNAFKAGYEYGPYYGIMKRMSIEHPNSFKHKRHILRLAINLKDLQATGRFNPTLSKVELAMVNSLAELDMEHVYNDALAIAGR